MVGNLFRLNQTNISFMKTINDKFDLYKHNYYINGNMDEVSMYFRRSSKRCDVKTKSESNIKEEIVMKKSSTDEDGKKWIADWNASSNYENTDKIVYKRFDSTNNSQSRNYRGRRYENKYYQRDRNNRRDRNYKPKRHDKKSDFHNRKDRTNRQWRQPNESSNRYNPSNQSPTNNPTQEKVWKPKTFDTSTVAGQKEMCLKNAKGCLNKMTRQTFEKLSDKYLQIALRESQGTDDQPALPGLLKLLIDQIFEQALLQPDFCELYANLCAKIYEATPIFRKELLGKCQEEFEKDAREPGDDLSTDEKLEFYFLAKKRTLGNIKFIAELYKNKILVVPIIHACINRLLKQTPEEPDEEQLESLCKLLLNVGSMIEVEKYKEIIDGYFEQMKQLREGGKVCARIRFMMEDVCDVRNNNWKSLR